MSESSTFTSGTPAAKESIPTGYDGTVLNMSDADLDHNVTELVENGVELPWWAYGRQIESEDKAPDTRGTLQCDKLSECLPHVFRSTQQRNEDDQRRAEALRKHREKFPTTAPRPAPSGSVAESWERIKAWFAEYAEDKRLTLATRGNDYFFAAKSTLNQLREIRFGFKHRHFLHRCNLLSKS